MFPRVLEAGKSQLEAMTGLVFVSICFLSRRGHSLPCVLGPVVAQLVKNLPAVWETQVPSLGREDPLGKGMATHSSVLAWRVPRTEEPGGLQSVESQRVARLSDCHTRSAHVVQGAQTLSGVSVQRALILFRGAPPLCPKVKVKSLSRVQLSATPWTVTY